MSASITLTFIEGELVETRYRCPVRAESLLAVRGRAPGAFGAQGTFQWTSAVHALALFFIGCRKTSSDRVALAGVAGSPAASLDYALSKEPAWLAEMFGTDSSGAVLARRMIRRTNSNRKRPGPVVLWLNETFLQPENIELIVDGELAGMRETESLERALLEKWRSASAR